MDIFPCSVCGFCNNIYYLKLSILHISRCIYTYRWGTASCHTTQNWSGEGQSSGDVADNHDQNNHSSDATQVGAVIHCSKESHYRVKDFHFVNNQFFSFHKLHIFTLYCCANYNNSARKEQACTSELKTYLVQTKHTMTDHIWSFATSLLWNNTRQSLSKPSCLMIQDFHEKYWQHCLIIYRYIALCFFATLPNTRIVL